VAMESVHFLFNYRRLSNRRSGTSIGGPRGTLNAACGGCAATSPSRSNSRRRRTALESRGSSAYGRLFTADELTSLRPYAARGPAFVAVPQASASGPPSVCSCCVPRARTCVAFGVECLVNCEDDVAVFERGSGCVDGLLEGGGDVADDEGSLALAFVNPRGGLAAVGRVADDGVVLYWLAVRRPVEAERTLTVIDPFLCVGTVEADQRSRIGCCARRGARR
jgi:hypothetical protein